MSETKPSKEQYIEELFASIAPRYDMLNSLLSFNRHKYWRSFSVRQCRLSQGDRALDVAAGTLDFAVELTKAVGPSGEVVAVDFCRPMLDFGRQKIQRQCIANISLIEGNAEHLPVPSNSFRAATIGFALRNVADVECTVAEMTRAVEPGGRVVCLELARPQGPVFKHVYNLYFNRILPFVGGLVSRGYESYAYLPASLRCFHTREELVRVMEKVGLADIEVHDLTGGIVAVHAGTKR